MTEPTLSPQPRPLPPGIEIRSLSYPDLPQVTAIERRVFPTPWSLAMFVLELSKTSGICLAAVEGERLVGYLICSRYDTVWHVMNVAVDIDHQRQGLASALLADLYERVGRRQRELHARGAAVQRRGDPPVRARGLPRGRAAPPLLPGQRGGRARHVAHARDPRGVARGRAQRLAAVSILALETSCDDTCAAVLEQDGTIRSNVISSQEQHARFGGVVPEIASRHHLELIDAVVAEALSRAGSALGEVELVAATRGPGLIGALLVGLSSAKAIAAARRAAVRGGRPPAGPRGGELPARRREGPFEPPFMCLIASGGHTLLAGSTPTTASRCSARTLDDAAGEAFDKGARMLGLGYPGGAALERLAAGGDPEAFSFPGSPGERRRGPLAFAGRLRGGPRLLLRRGQDGAAVQAA